MRIKIKRGRAAAIVIVLWGLASLLFEFRGFVLGAPVALLVLAYVPVCRAPAIGTLAGWLVWFYDGDFGMNPGGPEAPISKAIQNWLGLGWDNYAAPVLFLMLAGGCVGLLCGLAYHGFGRARANQVQ